MNLELLFCFVLALLLIQTAFLVFIFLKKRRQEMIYYKRRSGESQAHPDQGNLALTKKQLYREIERHQETEIALQETQTYLQGFLDSMPSILIGVSPDGCITHWNKFAENAAGLKSDEVFGRKLKSVFPALPVTKKDIQKTVSTGEAQYRKNIKQGHGSNAHYTDIVIYPLIISDQVEEAVVMATDVSQRVHMENRLIQNDKMQGLGEMAAGLAHEINNPLAGIVHHVQNIKRRTSINLKANRECAEELGIKIEDVHKYLYQRNILSFIDNIKISGDRASQIVTNMLNFSRSSSVTKVSTDLKELINHTIELTLNSVKPSQFPSKEIPNIELDVASDLKSVECAPVEIQQVLINLIRNALQSFESEYYENSFNAKVTVSAHNAGQSVKILIRDNGPGIDAQAREHIFEPFFTTKKTGLGTGLGLSVCYFIISEHHEGEIDLESEPGKGACFTITLPILNNPHLDKSVGQQDLSPQEQREYHQEI